MAQPVPLATLLVLALNDQVLKTAWPGPLTGILSDVAGMVVVPLALQAAWEVLAWLRGTWHGPRQSVLAVAIVVVALAFVAVQIWPPATDAYRVGLGLAQWPLRAAIALIGGVPVPDPSPVITVGDAGDLLALPALGVTWWLGRHRAARAERVCVAASVRASGATS